MIRIEIDSLNDEKMDIYSKLSEVQLLRYNEPKPGIFIAESENVIMRAISAGYEPISFLVQDELYEKEALPLIEKTKEILGEDLTDKMVVYTAKLSVINGLTGFAMTRGILAALKRKPMEDIDTFIRSKKRIAILYDIVNPTNVGAIIRIPLIKVDITIEKLNELGFATVAMALTDDSISISDKRIQEKERIAIVLGSEGEGLPKQVIDACTYTVKIPMYHGVDSLNVAAASAVAFYELQRG